MLSLTPRTNFGALSFNDFVDDMFSSPFFRGSRTQMPSMKTDIKEKDGMYLLDIDLPGFEKENIKAEPEILQRINPTKNPAMSTAKEAAAAAAEASMSAAA